MEIQSEGRMFQNRMKESLEKHLLASPRKKVIYYDTDEIGGFVSGNYRRARTWIMENVVKPASDHMIELSLGGLAVAGGILYFFPETQKSINLAEKVGGASIAALFLKSFVPFDKWIYQNPADVARTIFRNSARPWLDVYHAINPTRKIDLDRYISMTKSPGAVFSEFPDEAHQKVLGVSIASLTDILSTASSGNIAGLKLEHVIEMISKQRIGTEEDTKKISQLIVEYSAGQLVKLLDKIDGKEEQVKKLLGNKYETLELLRQYVENYELGLKVTDVKDIRFIGSQISLGVLNIDGSVGDMAGIYAGMHSSGLALPRIYVHGNVGQSYLTKSDGCYSRVTGNAEYGLMDGSTGGMVLVDNIIDGSFAIGMDDSNRPSVIVCRGGVTHEPRRGEVRNGLIFSLGRNSGIDRPGTFYRFRNGELETGEFKNSETSGFEAADMIDQYVEEWERNYRRPVWERPMGIAA